MPTDDWDSAADSELQSARKTYVRKTVRWNIEGESTAREGIVDNVERNGKKDIVLKVKVHMEGEEPFLSTISSKEVILIDDNKRPGLKVMGISNQNWQGTYPG